MTQILIVDDNQLTALGIRSIIDSAPGMTVCGSAERGSPAVLEVARSHPHVAVLCVTQCVEDCLGDVAALSSMVPVLLVTTDENCVAAALRHGATGCLIHHDTTPDRLISALAAVASGQAYLSSDLLQSVIENRKPSRIEDRMSSRVERRLTQRECEVMDLVSMGLSNDDIATRLFLSEKTVRNYLSHAYAVLGASSRTQAALSWRVAKEPAPKTPA